jgi:hypothetical protein
MAVRGPEAVRFYKRIRLLTSNDALPARCYFGLIDGLPPGVPGGVTTGILSPERGGVCFICGSIPAGGVIIPPEWLSSEPVAPLAGGTAGALG